MVLLASENMRDSTTEKDVQYMHMSDMNDHCSYTCNYWEIEARWFGNIN